MLNSHIENLSLVLVTEGFEGERQGDQFQGQRLFGFNEQKIERGSEERVLVIRIQGHFMESTIRNATKCATEIAKFLFLFFSFSLSLLLTWSYVLFSVHLFYFKIYRLAFF